VVDVVGYFFLDDSEYDPDPKLAAFLAAGPPPVYIGLVQTSLGVIVYSAKPNLMLTFWLRCVNRVVSRCVVDSDRSWSTIRPL